jgi:hypothetical protein
LVPTPQADVTNSAGYCILCPHALGWHNNRPMLLGYQTGGQTSTGTLPADPRQRWRCLYIDEIDQIVADNTPSQWATAENYNHSHPFPAIDEVRRVVSFTDVDAGLCGPVGQESHGWDSG